MFINERALILPTRPYGSGFQRVPLKAGGGCSNDRQARYSIAWRSGMCLVKTTYL